MTDPWMQTHSGEVFDFEDIANAPISLEDIAMALANTCRFNGATIRFYSVAEHSIYVARQLQSNLRVVTTEQIRAALLHDAHEAYIGDVIAPLKALPAIREALSPLVRRIDARIYEAFDLSPPGEAFAAEIHRADLMVLLAEKRDLLTSCERDWGIDGLEPSQFPCHGWGPRKAWLEFMRECLRWGLK